MGMHKLWPNRGSFKGVDIMEPSLATVKTRFWSKVENTEPGTCWLWTGATTRGYGYVKNEGRATYAHIVSYQWANGLVPEGLELDHLCRASLCVNPEHLEAVTHKVNLQRGRSFNRERIAC